MIKIIFYQSFGSKEVKYLQSNEGGAENPTLENPHGPSTLEVDK